MFASSREVGRIPLVAVLGAAGSGKTTFLNRLLALESMQHSVVLLAVTPAAAPSPVEGDASVNQGTEAGSVALEHARVLKLPAIELVNDSGCLCCGMNSALGDALRDLFLQALSRRVPRVDRVLIESRAIDPSVLRLTVRHAPFLGQRYVYQATITVVDAKKLQTDGVGAALVALLQQSDCVVLSHADLISEVALASVTGLIRVHCPQIKIIRSDFGLEALVSDTLH